MKNIIKSQRGLLFWSVSLIQLKIKSLLLKIWKYELEIDYIHLFVKTQTEYIDNFPKLKPFLKRDGMLWLSWPKGGKLGTDLNIKSVIKLGYDFGLVESTCLSINDIWSGLKFTHPKKGKVYNNSYGKLNEKTTTKR